MPGFKVLVVLQCISVFGHYETEEYDMCSIGMIESSCDITFRFQSTEVYKDLTFVRENGNVYYQ